MRQLKQIGNNALSFKTVVVVDAILVLVRLKLMMLGSDVRQRPHMMFLHVIMKLLAVIRENAKWENVNAALDLLE